ncbi:hypothetical protein AB0N38_10635 [Micromonospora aurantiaca]
MRYLLSPDLIAIALIWLAAVAVAVVRAVHWARTRLQARRASAGRRR